MMSEETNLGQEVKGVLQRTLHWLDVYTSTRSKTIFPSVEFQRKVLEELTKQFPIIIQEQLDQYEAEEKERQAQRAAAEESGKKGWLITEGKSKMGFNWSVLERMLLAEFENKNRFYLYRKRRSEIVCEECSESEEEGVCQTCYGTGFEGGYYYSDPIPTVHAHSEDETKTLRFYISFFRTIIPGDVIVTEEGDRWVVNCVSSITKMDPEEKTDQPIFEGWLVSTTKPSGGEVQFPLTHA